MDQEQNPEIARLRSQLNEALTGAEFFETAVGQLWTQLATKEINKLINDITSDKYIDDHTGYVNANLELKLWRTMLRKMQAAASPERRAKIEERLEAHGVTK